MFEPKTGPQDDSLVAARSETSYSAAEMTSLIRRVLAAREEELRSAEAALEVESLRRRLEIHQRYASSLSAAVEQALVALCGAPPLSSEPVGHPQRSDTLALSQVSASTEVDAAAAVSSVDSQPAHVGGIGSTSKGLSTAEQADSIAYPNPLPGLDDTSERTARMVSEAESRIAALLRESSDITTQAQEAARKILERALEQGADIVARAEEISRLVDEKVTQVEAVTAPPGSTVYQRALELARTQPPVPGDVQAKPGERGASLPGDSGQSQQPSAGRDVSVDAGVGEPGFSGDGEFGILRVALGQERLRSATGDEPSGNGRTLPSPTGLHDSVLSSATQTSASATSSLARASGDHVVDRVEDQREAPDLIQSDVHPQKQRNGYSLTTVGILPLRSFASVARLEKATRAIAGVKQVRVLSYRGGLLEMIVEHDSQVPLDEALLSLGGCQLRILDYSDTRLWLQLTSQEARPATPMPP